MITIRQSALRILGAIVFGLVAFGVLYWQCSGEAEKSCYISPDAWVYIPVILFIPALVVQFFAWYILDRMKHKYSPSAIGIIGLHSILAFLVFRIWLMITGQDFYSFPRLGVELFKFTAGAAMGFVVFLATKRSNKSSMDAPVKQ